jgi:hypothetical protein
MYVHTARNTKVHSSNLNGSDLQREVPVPHTSAPHSHTYMYALPFYEHV